MSGLSRIAETLLDKARSRAKNHECELVQVVHLLAAIREWGVDTFDSRYPGQAKSIQLAMAASRGNSLRLKGVAPEVQESLKSLKTHNDVWDLADLLMKETKETRDKCSPNSSLVAANLQSFEESSDFEQTLENSSSDQGSEVSFPFAINSSLAETIKNLCDLSLDDVVKKMLDDTYSVALRILNNSVPDLKERTEVASHLKFASQPRQDKQISDFVAQMSLIDKPNAARVATKYGLALVDVGEWAASIDDLITAEETDRIDEVRIEVRRQLGDRIDGTSDAMIEFETSCAGLMGMETIKTQLRKRVDYLLVNRRRQKRGLKCDVHRMHMAFLGNPGTGKTTVARLFGTLLNNLGLLPSAKFIETDRAGLVGKYVGDTEAKTMSIIKSADGGVLFVDEAYALNDKYNKLKGYGEVATEVLVKQMEDRRESLVVILAGYTQPTREFLDINPGMKSRVPLMLDFPDFTNDELQKIARKIAERRGLRYDKECEGKVMDMLESKRKAKNFGNARDVENLLDEAQRNAVARNAKLGNLATENELNTLIVSDIPEVEDTVKIPFGFR